MRTDGSTGVLLSTLIIASLMVSAISLFSISSSSAAPDGLTPHAPIYIISNDNFIPANGVVGGIGTENDPYTIENWVISAENAHGIWIENTTAYFIVRNCLVENGVDNYYGIYLENVVNGRVENCISRNNYDGIHQSYSSYMSFSYNTLENNYDDGIHVNYSSYTSASYNTFENNNSDGIQLSDSSYNSVSHNTFDNNHASGVHLQSNSSNNTVDNNLCVNSIYGIHLSDSDNNLISNNICKNNTMGIRLKGSSINVIQYNICENNAWGINVRFSSDNNTLHHNCLLFNTENNAYDDNTNAWDDGSEGNRWSDWQPPEHPDADGDGLVDEPRPIKGGSNQDRYPIVFGVRVMISPRENSAKPSTTLEYTVKVMNLNYVDDNFDLTWVDTENWGDNIWFGDTSLWISGCGSEKTTTLYVHIPHGVAAGTEDNITVIATSQTDNTVIDNDSCVAQVDVAKGVEVSISPEYQSSEPSTVLDYTVTVRNTGNVDDVYDLSWVDNAGWGDNIWLDDNSLSARFGDENSTSLHVHIPDGIEGGTRDNITVTATSQTDNTATDNDSGVAQVDVARGVEVLISPEYQSGEPSTVLDYTVTIRNTGNVDDTYDLTVIDNENWSPMLDNSSLSIPFGENQTTTLSVHIPENALGLTQDNITVTATGTGVENSASCIAQAEIVGDVEVSISPDYQENVPSGTLEYEVTITNTGNFIDNYVLTASDNENWGSTVTPPSRIIDPGASDNAILSVTIPEKALGNKEATVFVTATSTENAEVSDSDNAIARVSVVRGVEVTITPSLQSGTPGMILIYIVKITNIGNIEDTYDTIVTDNAGWDPKFDLVQVKLAPYGSAVLWQLEVTVPEDVPVGARDNITITATSTDNVVSEDNSCIANRSKAEFSLTTLYIAALDVDFYIGTGSKLVVKFYTYGDAYENESIFWSGTTPTQVVKFENVPHPDNIGVKKARLDLTTDDTDNVISTVATFIVARNALFGRLTEIYLEWPFADANRRNVLFAEITDIYLQWPFAPF